MPTGRYRGDCCRSLLRGSLRALNYLLAIVGVLMVAYALFMYVQWSEAAPPPPAPPSPPHHHHHPPEPAPAPRAQLTVADEVEPQHDTIDYEKLDLWRKDEPDSPPSGGGTGKLAKCAFSPCHHLSRMPREQPCPVSAIALPCCLQTSTSLPYARASNATKHLMHTLDRKRSARMRPRAGTPGSSTSLAAPACLSSSPRPWAS